VEEAVKHYTILKRIRSNQTVPPKEFTDVLNQERDHITKVTLHVEEQKLMVAKAIDQILVEFTNLCNKSKKDVFARLDNQVITLTLNYQYYQSRLNNFYYQKEEDNANLDQDQIIAKLNQIEKYEEYELAIKNIRDDLLSLATLGDTIEEKLNAMYHSLRDMEAVLKAQSKALPTLFGTNGLIKRLVNEATNISRGLCDP
jgi:vacuolar-type H+-ATPase subunit I/STV1